MKTVAIKCHLDILVIDCLHQHNHNNRHFDNKQNNLHSSHYQHDEYCVHQHNYQQDNEPNINQNNKDINDNCTSI